MGSGSGVFDRGVGGSSVAAVLVAGATGFSFVAGAIAALVWVSVTGRQYADEPLGPMSVPGVADVEYALPYVWETERPPLGYRGSARAVVEFVPRDKVAGVCSGAVVVSGAYGSPLACTQTGERLLVRVPNPCDFPWDPYAALLCHEVGHVNGWVHGEGGA